MADREAQAMAAATDRKASRRTRCAAIRTRRARRRRWSLATRALRSRSEIPQVPPRNDLDYYVGMWYHTRSSHAPRAVPRRSARQAELEAAGRVPADDTVLGNTNARKVLQIAMLVLNARRAHSARTARTAPAGSGRGGRGHAPATKPSAWYVPISLARSCSVTTSLAKRGRVPSGSERNPENGWSPLGLAEPQAQRGFRKPQK
jgi:hypothetical protein